MWRVLEEGAQAGLAFSTSHQTHRQGLGQTDALLSGCSEPLLTFPLKSFRHQF